MKVIVCGASGRVGKYLTKAVLEDQDMELIAGIVSGVSPHKGKPIEGSHIVYSDCIIHFLGDCDLIIDFSSPKATNGLLDLIKGRDIALVLGTTAMDEFLQIKIDRISADAAVLQGANFAHGFEAYLKSVLDIAQRHRPVSATVREVYHKNKKKAPSGTSVRIAKEVSETLHGVCGGALPEVPVEVVRDGDTVGINSVRLNLGASKIDIAFTVHTLEAYAKGALEAGHWLVKKPAGLYVLKDMILS
ncbi:MAG: hypothetical protein JKY45_09790 [Emcibacter sp.]|nr:hypothetical protein [Emcibacter sp.]